MVCSCSAKQLVCIWARWNGHNNQRDASRTKNVVNLHWCSTGLWDEHCFSILRKQLLVKSIRIEDSWRPLSALIWDTNRGSYWDELLKKCTVQEEDIAQDSGVLRELLEETRKEASVISRPWILQEESLVLRPR